MPAKELLDVDMDFLKSPLFVESAKLNGTEKSHVGIVDGDNTFYHDFDGSTSGSYYVSDLTTSTNFFVDSDAASDSDTFLDLLNASQQIHTVASTSYDFEMGKSSCNNNDNLDFCATSPTDKQFSNPSTPSSTNHFDFSGNNGNHKENLNITIPLSEETNMKKEDMDEMKEKSRFLRNKKNAEMARASRQKKKDHLQNLENELKGLTEDNGKLKKENKSLLSIVKHKDREINYLKNILANHSTISQMIDYLSVKKKIHLSSEFSSNNHWPQISTPNCDQTSYDDECYANNNRPHVAGICLHFKPDNHVSLEFCVKCSQSSQMIINQNQGQYCLDKENSNS